MFFWTRDQLSDFGEITGGAPNPDIVVKTITNEYS